MKVLRTRVVRAKPDRPRGAGLALFCSVIIDLIFWYVINIKLYCKVNHDESSLNVTQRALVTGESSLSCSINTFLT